MAELNIGNKGSAVPSARLRCKMRPTASECSILSAWEPREPARDWLLLKTGRVKPIQERFQWKNGTLGSAEDHFKTDNKDPAVVQRQDGNSDIQLIQNVDFWELLLQFSVIPNKILLPFLP